MAPKVRPRPRARQQGLDKDLDGSGSPAKPSTSKSATPTRSNTQRAGISVDSDDDDFFMRSNGAMWKRDFVKSAKRSRRDLSPSVEQQQEREQEQEPGDKRKNSVIELSSSSDHPFSESESDEIPPSSSPIYGENEDGSMPERPNRRRRKGPRKIKQHPLPSWANPKAQERKRREDEIREDLLKRFPDSQHNRFLFGFPANSNTQSRSQSQPNDDDDLGDLREFIHWEQPKDTRDSSHVELTPPPASIAPPLRRSAVPRFEQDYDEPFDVAEPVNLNPALMAIRQNIKTNPVHQSDNANIGPEILDIKCKVYVDKPGSIPQVDPTTNTVTRQLEKVSKSFRYRRADNFESLFKYLAQPTLLNTRIDGIVMTYEGHRVFTGATPASLNMWDKADMEAMTVSTYEFLKKQKKSQHMAQVAQARKEEEEERRNRREQEQLEREQQEADRAEAQEADAGGSSDVEFVGATQKRPSAQNSSVPPMPPSIASPASGSIRLTLRGMNRNEEYKIQISGERKCATLLNSYISHFKIDQRQAPSYILEFDGEKLDNETLIKDTELEDEDLLNVVKLNK